MVEQRTTNDPASEQQSPEHSPVEDEFKGNQAGTPAARDGITIFGYSLGAVLVAVFVLFLVLAVVAIFTT